MSTDETKIVEGTVEDKKEEKTNKKDNAFTKFFQKAKKNIGDTTLEMRIHSKFDETSISLKLYQDGKALSFTPFHAILQLKDNYMMVYGEDSFQKGDIIKDGSDNLYVITNCEVIDYGITIEEKEQSVSYVRKVTKITFNQNRPEEVDVIRVGDKFYLRQK